MKDGKTAGRLAIWGDKLDRVLVGGNAHRLDLTMREGFLDPLSLMSFKVLPAHHKVDSEPFAKKPVGSGPFVYEGIVKTALTFKENTYYGGRAGRGGLPRAREVLLYAPADPVKALKQGDIDIAFDLTAEQAGKMRDSGMTVVVPAKEALNRRIYFLAINHRRPKLQDIDVRRGLCHAIDREALLDEYFRKGIKEKLHRSINGPYPAGSWACDPTLFSRKSKDILDPFDLELARAEIKRAAAKFDGGLSFTLKYPTGDKATEEAVKALCARVSADVPPLMLTAEGVNPHDLREAVESDANYDLAYYHYDFPEGAFWLWPLLGFGEKGTENFLGYTGPLLADVQRASQVRYFPDVRRLAQKIHRDMLINEMPFVPLWQLDPLYAVRPNSLDTPPFDPWQPFAQVAEWRAKR